MHSPSPIQSPRFGRTAAIAAAILASVAVFQLGAVTVAFCKKSPRSLAENGDDFPHPPPLKIDVSKIVADSPPPENPGALLVDPLLPTREERSPGPRPLLPHAEPLPLPPEATTEPPGSPPPRPTPVPLSVFTPKPDPRYGELVEQGKLLRNSGDTAAALVKFREAVTIEPGNPLAIAEMAFTFEKMSLLDKAAEQWKRIFIMGERAGVFYGMAKGKLESAMLDTMRTVGGAGPSNGKVLALGPVALADDPDPSSAKRFALAVPIRARAAEAVAVNEMKVFVLFYERVNGKDIAKTIADVGNRWTSAPVDWKDGDTETLEVSYDLSTQQARTEKRDYYGYIVRLYYRGELQDTKAEPAGLSQKFPASPTLSE